MIDATEGDSTNTSMRKVFIAARHGSHGEKWNLNEEGVLQMNVLAAAVVEISRLCDLRVSLLCSTAPRAQQGARIIAQTLKVQDRRIVADDCFWVEKYHNFPKIYATIDPVLQEGTLVVLITHLPAIQNVSRYVMRKFLQGADDFNIPLVGHGEGFMVSPDGVCLIP